MTTQDLFDLMFVIVVTAIVAFMIVATWSLLGGLVAYIIAILLGGSMMYVWSGSDE
jgi:hypothetical protein